MNIEFRKMSLLDIDRVMEIELSSFVEPWKKEDLTREILSNEFAHIYVGEILLEDGSKKIISFYDFWITFDSATICQIATDQQYRNQGIGYLMMQEIISDCYAARVSNITLEVRKNNEKARKLYKKCGFEEVLEKPHYYPNGEDAIYMIRGMI